MPKLSHLALCFKMPRLELADANGDVWLPMVPAGIFKGDDGREWTNNNPDDIVARFSAKGQKRPFDIEHSTYMLAPKGKPAPAIGWIMELKNDNGQVMGRVEFNKKGQHILEEEEYAYYSPTFTYDSNGFVTSVTSAGLTNEPNLDLPALNRSENQEDKTMPLPKAVADALALAENATEQDAVAAIGALKSSEQVALNRASQPDLTKFVPIDTHKVALNRAETAEAAVKAVQDRETESLVDAAIAAGKVAPANKEMYLALCRSEGGLEHFEKFAEGAVKIVSDKPIKTPVQQQSEKPLEEHEIAMCRKLHISEDDFLKSKLALNKGA